MNPPNKYRSDAVDLTLKNSQKIMLVKEDENLQTQLQTQYRLSIPNLLHMGLKKTERSDIDNFIRDVVLAFNLLLDKTALSIRPQNESDYDLKHKKAEPAVRANSERSGIPVDDIVHFESNELIYITVYERDHVTTVSNETIDENELTNTLNLINKADRHQAPRANTPLQKRLKLANLKKALKNYEDAMSVFDTRTIFKDLYTSLELAINWDQDLTGPKLDAEITRVTKVSQTQAEDWRDLNNRLKHMDKNQPQLTTFEQGLEKLPHLIDPLRLTSKKVIIQRLNSP